MKPVFPTDLPDAEVRFDVLRPERIGLEEVVYSAGKSAEQLRYLIESATERESRLFLTRLSEAQFMTLPPSLRDTLDYCAMSRTARLGPARQLRSHPRVAIVCAGSSDVPVAREAQQTLAYQGESSGWFADVGVAGLWRLTSQLEAIRVHAVVIVVAGMDAALPSVLGGLIGSTLIGVPTSVGYGVAEGGHTALHAMLASCAPGIAVVNIDNGYGAACAALRVVHAIDAALAVATSADARAIVCPASDHARTSTLQEIS